MHAFMRALCVHLSRFIRAITSTFMLEFQIICHSCSALGVEVPFETFLSSPLEGKRDTVVTIFVRCMWVRLSEFVRTITCTIMHGFQNNLAQLFPLRRRSAV